MHEGSPCATEVQVYCVRSTGLTCKRINLSNNGTVIGSTVHNQLGTVGATNCDTEVV